MNTNENIQTNASEDIIVLGIASAETQGGGPFIGEPFGDLNGTGITDE